MGYLKYWRAIRTYVKVKYGLTQADLDVLLFLHDEKYFSRDDFKNFTLILPWDKSRFEKLRQQGWIEIFRKRGWKKKTIYQLSHKANTVVVLIYKKLNGEELPMSPNHNPMFRADKSYTESVYKAFIIKMNQTTKQLRHQPPEL